MIQRFLHPICFSLLLNLTAISQSHITIDLFVHNHYTESPLEAALITVSHNGSVVDSSYADTYGRTKIIISLTDVIDRQAGVPSTLSLSEN
jgi:hypothetical protein